MVNDKRHQELDLGRRGVQPSPLCFKEKRHKRELFSDSRIDPTRLVVVIRPANGHYEGVVDGLPSYTTDVSNTGDSEAAEEFTKMNKTRPLPDVYNYLIPENADPLFVAPRARKEKSRAPLYKNDIGFAAFVKEALEKKTGSGKRITVDLVAELARQQQ
ncbi:hypothetical protein SAMD00023353_0303530 [Rosellinia necatrix]|uniref:Uncharacterized protein n=1 Tax=Rosellinia necatrix TaxID=77044 RepID=A0A1S8A5B7_ROSNE|nr:hypothetical protein SAMD00023353_0303530 [Rosellinia necatrix]